MPKQLVPLIATLVLGIVIGSKVKQSTMGSEPQANFSETLASTRPLGQRAMIDSDSIPRNVLQTESSTQRGRSVAKTVREVLRQLDSSLLSDGELLASCDAYEAIRRMNPDETRQAMDQLAGDENAGNTRVLRIILMGLWARQDGASAIEYLLSQQEPLGKNLLITTCNSWTKNDLRAARQWHRENRDRLLAEGEKSTVITSIGSIAKYDIDFSFGEIETLPPALKGEALGTTSWCVLLDPEVRERFINYVLSMDEVALRDYALRKLFFYWSLHNRKSLVLQIQKMKASGTINASYDYEKEILKD